MVNYRDKEYFGIEEKIFATVRIQQTGSSSSRQHHAQYGDFEEDSHGIVFTCNNEERIPLFTPIDHTIGQNWSEIHVLLLCIQLIRIEYFEWIATAIPIVEKIDRKQE